mmetsp:Transcript_23669/g.56027  ORF Transcript_23669/g.56027 Transcript_23669/m.56027 type:complete len:976 (+) Transcript_23669:254-3181(+)
MLARPGAARNKATPQQRRRKQASAEETPDEIVRRLQRLPPNKKCADCPSKLTRCVNLTHGTFICNGCSGVHREFSHKIKGIGHSSFSTEEVAKLRHPESGNEAVNARFLARYDAGTSMPMPRESELDAIRTWIRTKYIDRKWCERGSPSGDSGGGTRSNNRSAKTAVKSSDRGSNSRRQIMPSTKPAAAPAPAAPAEDLFGFDTVAPSKEPASQSDSHWDAFGGSMQNQQSAPTFQADFGNAPPAAQSSAPADSATFEADFGNSAQQPTMVAMPTARQTIVQPAFDANFNRTPTTPQQQSQSTDGFADFPPQTQQCAAQPVQPNGFANFSPQEQTQPQSDGFASFSHSNLDSHSMSSRAGISVPSPNTQGQQTNSRQYSQPTGQPQTNAPTQIQAANTVQMPPQQTDQVPQNPMQQQQQQQQPSTQLNFGQFPVQSHQQNQASFESAASFQNQPKLSQGQAIQAGTFANFQGHGASQQTPTNTQFFAQSQVPPSQDFSSFSPSQPSQSSTQTEPQQNMQLTAQGGQGGTTQPSELNLNQTANAVSNGSSNTVALPTENVTTSLPDEPSSAAVEDEANIETNPNAFRPADESKKSAFDAFDNLSLEPSPSLAGFAAPAGTYNKQQLKQSMFAEGQTVVYTNSDGSTHATVKSVHYDDELKPYYTIDLGGRERQTDDTHLALPGDVAATSNDDSAVLQKTVSMLQSMNSEQLLQVQQFIQSLTKQSDMASGVNDGTAVQGPGSPTNSMAQHSPQVFTYPQQPILQSMGDNSTIDSLDFGNSISQASQPQILHQPQLTMNSPPGQTSQSGPQETIFGDSSQHPAPQMSIQPRTQQPMPAIEMQPVGVLPMGALHPPGSGAQPQMMHQPQLTMNPSPGHMGQSGPQETTALGQVMGHSVGSSPNPALTLQSGTQHHMPSQGMQTVGVLSPPGNASMAQPYHQDGMTLMAEQQSQPPQFPPPAPLPSLPPVVKEGNPFDF